MKQHVAADLRASPSINREAAYGNKSQSNFSLPTLVGQPFPIERDHHPFRFVLFYFLNFAGEIDRGHDTIAKFFMNYRFQWKPVDDKELV